MRTRLSTERRREQLLGIGAELFAKRPYEEVWIEEVAEIAQVSRGLLYHYFPTKREFFTAIVRAQSEQLLRMSAPDPALPVPEQLSTGLDVYLDYAQEHPDSYRLVHRAALGGDPEIRAICDAGLEANQRRIITALESLIDVDETIRLAVRAWVLYVRALVLDWLDNPTVGRDAVRALCVRTFFAAIGWDPAVVSGNSG